MLLFALIKKSNTNEKQVEALPYSFSAAIAAASIALFAVLTDTSAKLNILA